MYRKSLWPLVVVSLISLVLGFWISLSFQGGESAEARTEVKVPPRELPNLERTSRTFVAVSKFVRPSVVNISTMRTHSRSQLPGQRDEYHGFDTDPFEEFFRGNPFGGREFSFRRIPREPVPQGGLGSGVIIEADSKGAYVLTNSHVVAEADEIKITLDDGTTYDADRSDVRLDSKSDLAVIRIDGNGLVPALLGDSDKAEVGEWVIAIGSPFGLGHSVSAGIISAVGRDQVVSTQQFGLSNFIQTDAAINPGNSGGPLVNLRGEVIGINVAIKTSTGQYQGVGFAIPINIVKFVLRQLIDSGEVRRGFLGVSIRNLTSDDKTYFGQDGVLIREVFPEAPAAKANIKTGDLVVKFNGVAITDVNQLQDLVARSEIGKVASVVVLRGDEELDLSITIGLQPSSRSKLPELSKASEEHFGIRVQELSPELAEGLGYKKGSGVLISEVKEGSAAWKKGLRRGYLIKEIDRKKIKNIADFEQAMEAIDKKRGAMFFVQSESNKSGRYMVVK